jgi:hypothetical protein
VLGDLARARVVDELLDRLRVLVSEVVGVRAVFVGVEELPAVLVEAGISTPQHSRMVGTMSVQWWYWWRTAPRAFIPAGQWMASGLQTPPW